MSDDENWIQPNKSTQNKILTPQINNDILSNEEKDQFISQQTTCRAGREGRRGQNNQRNKAEKEDKSPIQARVEEDVSEIIQPKEQKQELKADVNKQDDWGIQEKKQTNQVQQVNQPPIRGNRGNRGNRENNTNEEFKNQNNNQARGGQNNYGNRDRGRGNYQNRGQGGNYQNRGQGGNYQNRGQGGNYQNRGQGGNYNNNRGNRGGYQGNRGNQEHQENRYYQGDRFRGGERNGGKYNHDQEQNGRRDYRNNNRYNTNNNEQIKTNPPADVVKPIQDKIQMKKIPQGLRVWPHFSIYIKKVPVTFAMRDISKIQAKILVIPYQTIKLQYYPGNIVNSSEINYKERIKKKGSQIQNGGSVYLQKSKSNYKCFAFLKVTKDNIDKNIEDGIKNLNDQIKKIDQLSKDITIVYPLSNQLGSIMTALKTFANQIQKTSNNDAQNLKQILLVAEKPQYFVKECMQAYRDFVQEAINENEICYTI